MILPEPVLQQVRVVSDAPGYPVARQHRPGRGEPRDRDRRRSPDVRDDFAQGTRFARLDAA